MQYRLVESASPGSLAAEVNALLADGYALFGELIVIYDGDGYAKRWIRELVKVEPSYSLGGSFRFAQEGVC